MSDQPRIQLPLTEWDTKNEHLNLYSPLEAAEYCGVSIQTLNRWRKAGHVGPSGTIEVGRGHLYTERALTGALHATNYDRRDINVEVRG